MMIWYYTPLSTILRSKQDDGLVQILGYVKELRCLSIYGSPWKDMLWVLNRSPASMFSCKNKKNNLILPSSAKLITAFKDLFLLFLSET